MSATTATVHALQGDTLDAICHRHYGRTAGVVEAALHANPHLPDLGPVLPMGTPVLLPAAVPEPSKKVQQLWQ